MWDVVLDALLDTLILLPFLFLLYILIELLEHKTAMGRPARALSGKFAPLIGGATGLLPMCGFSVMASKLYRKRLITVGTLLSVFIATSDEALLVLALSSLPVLEKVYTILALLGTKFVLAAGVGSLVDFVAKKCGAAPKTLEPFPEEEHEEHEHDEHEHEHEGHEHGHAHEGETLTVCEHKHESKWTLYLFSPLLHALEVAAVILIFNIAFGALFFAVDEEKVIGFLQGAGLWYQPLFASLVGLIPNCASSVVLAETYAIGGIGFSALLGGLVTNAGLGVFVLFRDVKEWKGNLMLLLSTFLLGVLFGYAASAIEIFI